MTDFELLRGVLSELIRVRAVDARAVLSQPYFCSVWYSKVSAKQTSIFIMQVSAYSFC